MDMESSAVSFTTVIVMIEDSNDNRPIFSQSAYEGVVPENSLADTVVNMSQAISAVDMDSGAFGRVTYSITSSNSQ